MVRPGYKQTEVGVIPDDWVCTVLGRNCETVTKGTTPTSIGKCFMDSGVSFIKAETISETGSVNPRRLAYIDEETHNSLKRSQLEAGDILLSIAGVLGRVGRVEREDIPANINQALAIIRMAKTSGINNDFLFHYLRSPMIIEQIQNINVQAAQANISLKNVRDFFIGIPPTLAEQESIASALSDVDALIESLERLIAKKRDIKRAAMQELLTGKRRLPGYGDDWTIKRLDSIAVIRSGGTPSTNRSEFWDGGIPWCTPTDVTRLEGRKYLSKTSRKITEQGLENSSAELIPARSVVMTSRATIGECAINSVPIATNQGFKNFIPLQGIDNEFLYYLLQTKKQDFIALCGGSTFPEISRKDLSAFEVRLPSDRSEQTAIGDILSSTDSEMTILENKLEKARLIKQGMMQELLTGRIRLV